MKACGGSIEILNDFMKSDFYIIADLLAAAGLARLEWSRSRSRKMKARIQSDAYLHIFSVFSATWLSVH